MAKLARLAWGVITLFGAFELGRLSKTLEDHEEDIISCLKNKVIFNVKFEEVKNEPHD